MGTHCPRKILWHHKLDVTDLASGKLYCTHLASQVSICHVQMPWSKQSTVEDLWAVFADYLDRVHARLDVAFNDSTVYIAYTAEVGHSTHHHHHHHEFCLGIAVYGVN